jgi:hypothetical protein
MAFRHIVSSHEIPMAVKEIAIDFNHYCDFRKMRGGGEEVFGGT